MTFPSIRLEGAILTADLLDAIAREDKHSQKPADFGLDLSTKVKDEIASTWASTKALWTGYQAKIANLHEGQTGVSETRNLFIIPLLALLGYQPEKAEAEIVNGKSYAISHRDISRDGFPLHIMGWHDSLEKKRDSGGPRISAHALVQEYLNLTEHSYGLITNGRLLRLLRDSSRLIKLSFLEFDLNRIFEEDLYADFAILFRLLHATRMPANRANASGSVIEKYHQESVDSGSRIRDGLAAAVAFSMQTVANGLLSHPANASLVDQLRKEPARANELHQNLLRWVYRTLFVLVIEERVLHHAPAATLRQRQLYRNYYSLQRLRRLADRPQLADRRSHDLWRAMHQTLRLYEDGGKGLPLGIAPLGSFLFREEGLQHLFQYQLDNRSLLQTLNRLSTFTHPDTNVRMRVNYSALDVEEFGSVYESLLELRPRIIPESEKLSFSYAQLAGNERKTSGSYYTPDSLVQCLLDSALNPVMEERLAAARTAFEISSKATKASPSPPSEGGEGRGEVGSKSHREALEKALLSIKVCDPAVGSGHFLIGAAHRLAQRLADIRAGEEALSPDVQRHALRDVVSRCLYGVDINPLSVELCKVSLWMLGMEPGKPLGFLDHHIRCGNSLLGATPELIRGGIPEAAYDLIEGDDKAACSALKKQNKRENPKLGEMFIADEAIIRDKLFKAAAAIDDIGDSRPEDVRRKETTFAANQQNYDFRKAWDMADLWCAAFVIKKRFPESAHSVPSTGPAPSDNTTSSAVPLPAWFGVTDESPKPNAKGGKASSLTPHHSVNAWGITTQNLRDFAGGGALPDGLLAEAKGLADRYQFFHWHLAFPEVFSQGGFDVSLGNPPWDQIQFDDREFFASRAPEIAKAANMSKRNKLIEELANRDPQLYEQFSFANRSVGGIKHFAHASGRFPLGSYGRLNLAPLFVELCRETAAPKGRIGIIVPSGIAFDSFNQYFFCDLVNSRSLCSFFEFENEGFFMGAGQGHMLRFCLLTLAGKQSPCLKADMLFQGQNIAELQDQERRLSFAPEDFALVNPNTKTCPIFRTLRDAELAKWIYRRVPVVQNETLHEGGDPWGFTGLLMFMMNTDSSRFRNRSELKSDGWDLHGNIFIKGGAQYLPLYEAKMVHLYNHRHGDHRQLLAAERAHVLPDVSATDLRNPTYCTLPHYWLPKEAVDERLRDKWQRNWLIGWRDVTDARASARTVVVSVVPRAGVGHKLPLALVVPTADCAACFLANLTAFVLDYCARQKVGGLSLTLFTFKQLPVLAPSVFAQQCPWLENLKLRDWLLPRVLELTYSAWDLEAFAQDCGWSGPPFRWDEERRFLLRCELDAAFFHLYLGTEAEWSKQPEALTKAFPTPRHAVAYIMDTFPIVKRKDESRTAEKNAAGEVVKPGRYITKDTILEIYDALAESMKSGQPYQTRLDPPPADPRCCHPPKK